MFAALIPLLGTIFQTVAASVLPNPEDELKRQQMVAQLQLAVLQQSTEIEKAAADNVKAEIQGESYLQRNWRPILMLVFAGLIVARFFGWTAPGLDEAEAMKLWDILNVGIGGYVIGRSAEKIVPAVAQAIKR